MNIKPLCCGGERPLGILRPTFSWQVTDCADPEQIAYQITMKKGETTLWDSGKIPSDQSVDVPYTGAPLEASTVYRWQVTVFTENASQTSPAAEFVTGLTDPKAVAWISPEPTLNAPILFHDFTVETIDPEAVVHVCGLGFFELYLNGKKVSDEWMNPVRTDYDAITYRNLAYPFTGETRKSTQYCTYRVADFLRPGKNTVALWLGNGWYRQHGRTVEGIFDYGDRLKCFLRLKNGAQIVETTPAWQCMDSPLQRDNLFYGETYDARISLTAPAKIYPVTEISPPAGRLDPQLCPPERSIEQIIPTQLSEKIYDAGRCHSGVVEFSCQGNPGDTVTLTFAERLSPDGDLDVTSTVGYVESDKTQIQQDTYILSGAGEESYCPRFVWHTFRYFRVEAPATVKITALKVHTVCTDVPLRAHFACSHAQLNTLHDLCINTHRANTHGCVPMDCPHRERLGYTGDGQATSLALMLHSDARQFYRKWVQDILDAQDLVTGFVPHTAPFHGGGGGPAWGSAIAIVPWNLYLQYGDRDLLRECFPAIRRWIGYLQAHTEGGLVTHEESGSWCLGDWVMPSKYPWSEPHLDEIKIPSELVNTAYFLICMEIYCKIATLLGETPEETILAQRKISADALNRAYLGDCYATGQQGCDIFPLWLNIVPEDHRDKIISHLIEGIVAREYCFDTGLLGTSLLFPLLARLGRNDIAVKMLLNPQYPSYGYMLQQGATALWETWEGNGAQTHTALTSFDGWFFYGLAGIQPEESAGGYKKFTLRPDFPPELDWLTTTLETPYGEIKVNWERKGETVALELTVPFNTRATLCLGTSTQVLTAGTYRYSHSL